MLKHITRRFKNHRAIYSLVAIVLIAASVIFIFHRNNLNSPAIHSNNPLATSNATNRSSTQNSQSQAPDQNSSTSTAGSPSVPSGPPPIVPSGNFVSNHHPGNGSPTSEASTCNTSPGASCYIELTNGDSVKKLDPEVVNANGSAIWYWDVKTAGLKQGSWTVKAVATMNGQTRTAEDTLQLVVQ